MAQQSAPWIISSTVLTLLVLPVLYRMFHGGERAVDTATAGLAAR